MEIGRIKLKIFLSSGQIITIKCKEFKASKLTNTKGNRELEIIESNVLWAIDLDEVVAYTAKKVLF
jgi:hypothetical protein